MLDEAARPSGETNRELLLSLWPGDLDRPPSCTWRVLDEDRHMKLRAKVIAADREDDPVTSANLTMHAMGLSMEMGVLLREMPAAAIADHLDHLIDERILEPHPAPA